MTREITVSELKPGDKLVKYGEVHRVANFIEGCYVLLKNETWLPLMNPCYRIKIEMPVEILEAREIRRGTAVKSIKTGEVYRVSHSFRVDEGFQVIVGYKKETDEATWFQVKSDAKFELIQGA